MVSLGKMAMSTSVPKAQRGVNADSFAAHDGSAFPDHSSFDLRL